MGPASNPMWPGQLELWILFFFKFFLPEALLSLSPVARYI